MRLPRLQAVVETAPAAAVHQQQQVVSTIHNHSLQLYTILKIESCIVCFFMPCRTLPGLKSLHLTHLHYLQPQQLLQCSALTQLTQLHTGGTACSRLRTHHLAWISRLTNLQDLSISKCGKVGCYADCTAWCVGMNALLLQGSISSSSAAALWLYRSDVHSTYRSVSVY